jgi:ribosomal-protein-alanine N-acetyltransferase
MNSSSTITTARLILSPPRRDDAREIFERYASDPEVTRLLGWPRHTTIAETEGFLALSAAERERWPAGPYVIRSSGDGRLLGGTGLHFKSPTEAETGYVLARDAWGHGYATEALGAMVDVARTVGVARLFAHCHPDNVASWRVLEKCGFVRQADRPQICLPNLAPDVLQDLFRYELALDRC